MKKINFKRKCPDCKKEKHIITHHIITKNMAEYLIKIGGYDPKAIRNLRNQLTIEICKNCEQKFHEVIRK